MLARTYKKSPHKTSPRQTVSSTKRLHIQSVSSTKRLRNKTSPVIKRLSNKTSTVAKKFPYWNISNRFWNYFWSYFYPVTSLFNSFYLFTVKQIIIHLFYTKNLPKDIVYTEKSASYSFLFQTCGQEDIRNVKGKLMLKLISYCLTFCLGAETN
jgi:hypothetical protein